MLPNGNSPVALGLKLNLVFEFFTQNLIEMYLPCSGLSKTGLM